MEANVTKKGEMHFLGLEERFASVADFDPETIMFKRFVPQASAFEEHAIDDGLYALGRTYEDGTCTYMVARRVRKMRGIPTGMPNDTVCKSVPASTYVEIRTTPRELGAQADAKAKRWLEEQSDYEENTKAFSFEYYPPECKGADDEMYIWVPLSRKSR